MEICPFCRVAPRTCRAPDSKPWKPTGVRTQVLPRHGSLESEDTIPTPRLPIAATALAVTLTTVSACQPNLEGTWSGYDSSGAAISLTFGTDNSLTVVNSGDAVVPSEGGILRYDVLDEVYPKRLYLQLAMGDTLRRQMPLGIYKIERGRLVICDVKATQEAIAFIPIGEPTYEWPTDFTGDCYGLDRS